MKFIKYKYILPVVLFLFGWIGSFIIVSNRRAAVAEMLNKAGREHQPVVWVNSVEQIGVENLFLGTMSNHAVKLIPEEIRISTSSWNFSASGVVQTTTWTFFGDLPAQILNVFLPDIYTRKGLQFNTVFEVYSTFHLFDVGTGSFYFPTYNPNGFQIDDFASCDVTYHKFESLPASFLADEQLPISDLKIDSELSTLICKESYYNERCIIWRYDISDGLWTPLLKREYIPSFAVGPYGNIIGIKFDRPGPPESIFIDGHTGQTLHTVYGMDQFIIGERWIACSESTMPGSRRGIVLIDMENNWEERRITFPCDNFSSFAMYEPPEGGVEEMLRMRGQ